MPGDTTISKSNYRHVKAVTDRIQEANSGSDKKLFVEHRRFGKNKLVVKSTGTSQSQQSVSAVKLREASEKDILKALKNAAKNDIGKLGPKAVDRYFRSDNRASLNTVDSEEVRSSAKAIKDDIEARKDQLEAKGELIKNLRQHGCNKRDAKTAADQVVSKDGTISHNVIGLLKLPVSAHVALAHAKNEYSAENVTFLNDCMNAQKILDNSNTTPEQKHAVLDLLIARAYRGIDDLNLSDHLASRVRTCPIGKGTYTDEALDQKWLLVEQLIKAISKNANETMFRLKGTKLGEVIGKLDMEKITKPITEYNGGVKALSLQLALDEANALPPDTSKPDETRATSSDVLTAPAPQGKVKPDSQSPATGETQDTGGNVSSAPAAEKRSPFTDSLGGPLGDIFEKFWTEENIHIVRLIHNHPNIPQLTENELAEIESMIVNPDISKVAVAKRAEKILNAHAERAKDTSNVHAEPTKDTLNDKPEPVEES